MKQLIKINNIITMKKLFVIAALALGVIGCSKMETSEIMPISFDSETGVVSSQFLDFPVNQTHR